MNHIRILRFERMEPRVPLSADLQSILLEIEHLASTEGIDRSSYRELLALLNRQDDRPDSSESPDQTARNTNSSPSFGETSVVRFRIEIRDALDQSVDVLESGKDYVARVFVQDTRELEEQGGVFQAIVDLEFSSNIRATGEVRLSEQFQTLRPQSEFAETSIHNLGGTSTAREALGNAEQFLLDASFQVEHTNVPTRIQVSPSTLTPEPVLLFGLDFPVEIRNVASDAFSDSPPTSGVPGEVSTPVPDATVPDIPTQNNLPDASFDVTFPEPDGTNYPLLPVSFSPSLDEFAFPGFDWWRDRDRRTESQRRSEAEQRDDDLAELAWPEPTGDRKTDKTVRNGVRLPAPEEEKPESEGTEETSKNAGLFFDESLFLEGTLVAPFHSRFQLRLQVFSPDHRLPTDAEKGIAAGNSPPRRNDLIDIAEILIPPDRQTWRDNVDDAIAGVRSHPNQDAGERNLAGEPNLDWAMLEIDPPADRDHRGDDSPVIRPLPDQRAPLAASRPIPERAESVSPPSPFAPRK